MSTNFLYWYPYIRNQGFEYLQHIFKIPILCYLYILHMKYSKNITGILYYITIWVIWISIFNEFIRTAVWPRSLGRDLVCERSWVRAQSEESGDGEVGTDKESQRRWGISLFCFIFIFHRIEFNFLEIFIHSRLYWNTTNNCTKG